jgi:hypothetical protein
MAYGGEYEWPTGRRGVVAVHASYCGVRDGERCSCGPLGYRAATRDPDTGERLVSLLLDSEAAAASWSRTRTREATRPRTRPQPAARNATGAVRVSEVAEDFLAAAADGRVRDPSGVRYSDDALEELRSALRGHVAEELGDLPLAALRRWQVQGFVNELSDSGLSARRLRAIVAAMRALAQYARDRGMLDVSAIDGVTVPSENDLEPRPFTTTDQLSAVSPNRADQVIPDAALWQLLKVVTVVFILIAIVLAAESI